MTFQRRHEVSDSNLVKAALDVTRYIESDTCRNYAARHYLIKKE